MFYALPDDAVLQRPIEFALHPAVGMVYDAFDRATTPPDGDLQSVERDCGREAL